MRPPAPEPVRVRPLTFSGQDGEPSASPDGRMVAFASARDGVSRIWIKQLTVAEAPLTSGPDRRPRFSPDGTSVLFLHGEGTRLAAYRVPLVGGEPRKVLDEVSEADWSPDGRRVAFLRSRATSGHTEWTLGTAEVQGGKETVLSTVRDFFLLHVRWSPDGRAIAVIKSVAIGFAPGDVILLVDASSGAVRTLAPERANRPVCGLAWSGAGTAIVFGQTDSVMGDSSGALARVILKSVGSGRERTLFWASNLFPTIGGSKQYASFDVLGPGRLVFDEMPQRMNLREVSLGSSPRIDRILTVGSSRDRQPTYSPDGEWLLFSSNRSGDPAKNGIWKVHTDGSGAARLVPGSFSNAEVSPDGRFATLLSLDRLKSTTTIRVAEIATGRLMPFQILVPYQVGPEASRILVGRSRWLPDGHAIAWLGEDENGLTGVFAQDFVPDRDTSATRRKLAGFSRDHVSESFAISPDGRRLALSTLTRSGSLMIAEGVPDVEPPARTARNP